MTDPGLCAAEAGRTGSQSHGTLGPGCHGPSRGRTGPFPGAPRGTGPLHCVLPSTVPLRTECINRKAHQMPEPGGGWSSPCPAQDCAGDAGKSGQTRAGGQGCDLPHSRGLRRHSQARPLRAQWRTGSRDPQAQEAGQLREDWGKISPPRYLGSPCWGGLQTRSCG